jgi:hypothetical protein
MLSRRRFLGQWSAASIFTAGRRLFSRTSLGLIDSRSNLSPSEFVERQWQPYGRIALKVLGDSVTIHDGYLAHKDRQKDWNFRLQRGRQPGTMKYRSGPAFDAELGIADTSSPCVVETTIISIWRAVHLMAHQNS